MEEIQQEQLEALEVYCWNNFHKIAKPGEEDAYESFPRFTYLGTTSNPNLITKSKCIVILLNDDALLEGIVVYCSQCCEQEVGSILNEIRSVAGEVIDFYCRMEVQELYRFVNPDRATFSDLVPETVPEKIEMFVKELNH
jgi:hypothetical protein